jgi:pimeloyl-ACP methyl ester carboxylesterase
MTVRIAWERHGAGPPLILIQGIGLARWGFGPSVDLLADRFEVIVYDNRGIGESDAPPGSYSIPMLAEDALQVLDEAGASSAHVLGASLGGMVAQQLAVEHPERVERLVLCCTTPGRSDAFPVPEPTVRLLAGAAALDRETALTKFTQNALSAGASDELVERIVRLRLEKPQAVAAWGAQVAAGAGFEGVDLGRIQARTLVLHGTEDNAVDPRNSALLAESIPDARSTLLDGLGHMFWWEAPELFARTVGDFLS